mgnify:CR=1 FL=1
MKTEMCILLMKINFPIDHLYFDSREEVEKMG